MAKPRATWGEGGTGPGAARATLALSGTWNAEHAAELEALVSSLQPATSAVMLDCSHVIGLDTLGAHLIHTLCKTLGGDDTVTVSGLKPDQAVLLREVEMRTAPPLEKPPVSGAYRMLSDIGLAVVEAGRDLANGVAFLGAVMVVMGRLALGRVPIRPAAIVNQLERVVLRSVPIIVLISFLVGAIIAQQSIFQLQTFGTVHFVADLLGILVLRELGLLLTAIMIAGRSGSSITAELGSMKMREEIDALETMGLDPMEVLVLPRILALMLGLPLLSFIASMAAIGGGATVAYFYGGVSADVFFSRLQNAIGFNTFIVGIIKAPFMALVIGMIACIEGFAVRGSAESLGQHTTASVVKSIFIVIVVDGLFAMFFAAIRY